MLWQIVGTILITDPVKLNQKISTYKVQPLHPVGLNIVKWKVFSLKFTFSIHFIILKKDIIQYIKNTLMSIKKK